MRSVGQRLLNMIKGESMKHAGNTTDPTILNDMLNNFKAHLSNQGNSKNKNDARSLHPAMKSL